MFWAPTFVRTKVVSFGRSSQRITADRWDKRMPIRPACDPNEKPTKKSVRSRAPDVGRCCCCGLGAVDRQDVGGTRGCPVALHRSISGWHQLARAGKRYTALVCVLFGWRWPPRVPLPLRSALLQLASHWPLSGNAMDYGSIHVNPANHEDRNSRCMACTVVRLPTHNANRLCHDMLHLHQDAGVCTLV